MAPVLPSNKTSAWRDYINHLDEISGWLEPGAAELFAWVVSRQKQLGIVGDLFEIGVHHGKSALLLALLADLDSERLGVCDVFSRQEANPTRSGRGDEEVFLANFEKWVNRRDRLEIHNKTSSELTVADTGAACRFFHIDGGHSSREVMADLATATRAISDQGIIALDDYFNSGFPGVSEGVCRFLIERTDELAPLAHGFNKLLLCRVSEHEKYLQALQGETWRDYLTEPKLVFKTVEFFSRNMLSYFVPFSVEQAQPRSLLKRISDKLTG